MSVGHLPLPNLVLAVLMVVLGHDVLMTADPHTTGSPHEAHVAGHELSETACHVPEGVPPAAPVHPAPPQVGGVVLPLPAGLPGAAGRIAWADAPCHPPGVLRALLQVFRN